jgi:predicted dehydrogenase
MTLAALRAGKDVYCESPFTYRFEEAREILEMVGEPDREAKRVNHVVQVGLTSLADARWLKAYDLIDKGKIGTVLLTTSHASFNSKNGAWNTPLDKRADPKRNLDWNAFLGSRPKKSWDPERYFRWRKYGDYSGGIAMQLLYPRLGEILMAIDGPFPQFPRRVSAFGGIFNFYDREVPDTLTIQIDYPSNHTVVLTASVANDVGIVKAIRGHQGTIFFEEGELVLRSQEKIVGTRPAERFAFPEKDWTSEHLKDFLACVRTRREPVCPPRFAYRVQVAMHMAVISYRTGNTAYWHRRKGKVYVCGEPVPP